MPRSRTASAASPKTVLPVRSQRNAVEAAEHQVGQDHPRLMPTAGKASLEAAHIEPVEGPVSKDKLAALAFNEEVLTVLVHDSTNPTDDPFPTVINGGQRFIFRRGEEMPVKRKFVEVLARSKKTVYTQEKVMEGGETVAYRNVPHTALNYPFTVINDPNAKGRDWLKSILAQA